jgi:predicted O-linked N-acetylglucosamine transferase (SPINDLY family)
MGHPGTGGADFVEYVLVDRVTTPPSRRAHFSEALLSLPMWHVTDYRHA